MIYKIRRLNLTFIKIPLPIYIYLFIFDLQNKRQISTYYFTPFIRNKIIDIGKECDLF